MKKFTSDLKIFIILLLFTLISSVKSFAQTGTSIQISGSDITGTITLDYVGENEGKPYYEGYGTMFGYATPIQVDVIWTQDLGYWAWTVMTDGGTIYFYNTDDTPNPYSTTYPSTWTKILVADGGSSLSTSIITMVGTGTIMPPACTAPTAQASSATFGTTTSTAIQMTGWTAPTSGATGYAVYINTANSFTAPTDGTTPSANTTYTSGQQCIYFGTGIPADLTVSGLSASTTYYYKIYAYNDCSGTTTYETTGLATSKSTISGCVAPTTQATSATFGITTSTAIQMTGWTAPTSSATGYAVYINTANSFTAPTDGTTPSANTTYASGQQCIYFGTGIPADLTVSGLSASTTYYYKIYAYNDCSGTTTYETTGLATSKSTISGCVAPTTQATSATFGTTTSTAIQMTGWTAPTSSATGYAVYINTANSFTAPTDGTTPSANTTYTSGQQCIYFGTGIPADLTVSGLSASTTYYYKIYAYNDCSGTTTYETTGLATSKSTTTPALSLSTTSLSGLVAIVGSASTASSFTVSGSNLTNNVVITSPAGFEVSLDGTTYGSINTINASGTLAATTVYVRIPNSVSVGAVSGNLSITSTGATSSTISLNGNVTVATKTWTGLTWDISAPTSSENAIIAGNYTISTDIICKNLIVNNGVVFQINAGNSLTVVDNVTNNGTIICKSPSDSGAAGSFISTTITNNGVMIMERYMTYISTLTPTSHYVSSPVVVGNSSNFLTSTVYTWTQSTASFSAYSGALSVGKGYYVRYTAGTLVSMSGVFNNAGYSLANLTSLGKKELVGNPYPSALDWSASSGWTKTNISPAIQYFNAATGRVATWSSLTGVGTNGGTRYISAMQGFYVVASAANAILSVNNDARVHSTTSYQKRSLPENTIKLKVSGNSFTDETVVAFDKLSNTDFEVENDVEKLYEESVVLPHLYTRSSDNKDLTINTLPETNVVPVNFKAGLSGTYLISAYDFDFADYSQVLVLDTKTGTTQDLKSGSLNFDYTTGENADRFQLLFNKSMTSVDNVTQEIDIYSYQKTLYVNASQATQVSVYDAVGRLVYTNSITSTGLNRIPLNMVSGIYVVKVVSGKEVATKKIVLE